MSAMKRSWGRRRRRIRAAVKETKTEEEDVKS